MNIRFSAPSKTFLAGEYAVLKGGPALVLATGPRFTFHAHSGETGVQGIPEGSPAARWIEKHSTLLKDWKIEFHDPHQGRGGFGASSAQFLFVQALTTLLESSVSRVVAGLDVKALLHDYREFTGGRASGADLLAQASGQVVRVVNEETAALNWPYADLDFAIVRTGQKISTHSHLAELNYEPLESLVGPATAVVETFGFQPAEKFISELRNFSFKLRDLNLQASQDRLEELERQPWCLVTKGCGALGADTLLVLFAAQNRDSVVSHFGENVVATVKDLSPGLEMQWSWT